MQHNTYSDGGDGIEIVAKIRQQQFSKIIIQISDLQ